MSSIVTWLIRVAIGIVTFVVADLAAGQEQVWLVSTRDGGLCGQTIAYWRWDGQCQWLPADAAAFAAADDPAQPTAFFVHGNRTDASRAVQMGWQVHRQLQCQAAGRPFRFVIWSWPSDRIQGGQLQDVRAKACRSDEEALLLAQVVSAIQPQVKVTYIGYSFGARVILGAMHLVAGGQLNSRALPAVAERAPMRAMLLASAVDADWLLPGRRNDLALQLADQVLITCNGFDPVLKRYHWLYGHHGPTALGYTGPAGPWMLGQAAEKLNVVNVSCAVGKVHDWDVYFGAAPVQRLLGWYALGEAPAAATASADEPPPAVAPADRRPEAAATSADEAPATRTAA